MVKQSNVHTTGNCAIAPKVTVVIITYNGSATIEAAIASVLAQTMSDFELVIVDDGSTDDTFQIVSAQTDPRIRTIRHNTNSGACSAAATGMEAATAPYIAMLDDDDTVECVWLERLHSAMTKSPDIGLAWSWSRIHFADKRPSQIAYRDRFNDNYELLIPVMLNWTPGAGGMMIRTEVVQIIGPMDRCLWNWCDLEFTIRFANAQRWKVFVCPEVLYHYNIHDSNISGMPSLRGIESYKRLVDKHRSILSQWPNVLADYYYRIGRQSEGFALDDADSYLRAAIRLNPTKFKYQLYWWLKKSHLLPLWEVLRMGTAVRARLKGYWRDWIVGT